MNKHKIITGYLLLLAAGTFWISWFLMPDAGTTDTNHILKIVKESRINVLNSVIMQIISCVLYMVVLFRLMQHNFPQKKITMTGTILFAIGVTGLCADAFFHLLAYGMTDDTVNIQQDVVTVMEFMQRTGVAFLIPLLLAFFIGSLVLAIGLRKQAVISNVSVIIFISAFAIGIIGRGVSHGMQYNIPGLTLITLGIFASGQAFLGMELVKSSLKRQRLYKAHERTYKYELLNNDFTSSN